MVRTMTDTMRAIAVTPREAGSARQVELPRPEASQGLALMHVLEVGIDGTDTESNLGESGDAPPNADVLVIGHEARSLVRAGGDGVPGFPPGEPVVPPGPRPDRLYGETLDIVGANGSRAAEVRSGDDGRFFIALSPGTYTLQPESPNSLPHAQHQVVVVIDGQVTTVAIVYDSGIR